MFGFGALALSLLCPGLLGGLTARDRTVQADAVVATESATIRCVTTLGALAVASDRFDVRASAIAGLVRSGEAGRPVLLALATGRPWQRGDGDEQLLVRALASVGAGIESDLEQRVMGGEKGGRVLALLVGRTGGDADAVARRLMLSERAVVRGESVHFIHLLQPVARASLVMSMLRDPDSSVSAAASNPEGSGLWAGDSRAEHPEAFEAFVRDAVGLLSSDQVHVVRAGATILRLFAPGDHAAAQALMIAADREELSEWDRTQLFIAVASVHGDRDAAAAFFAERMEKHPVSSCAGLSVLPVVAIGDGVLGRAAALMAATDRRESNTAFELLAPRDPARRAALAPRAVPLLIDALWAEDPRVAAIGAGALRAYGQFARDAVPGLIERIDRLAGQFDAYSFVEALIDVGDDDPRTIQTLSGVVRGPLDHPARLYVSGETLRRLASERGDRAWVRGLVRPVLSDREHPLHMFVLRYPPATLESVIAECEGSIRETLAVATGRITPEDPGAISRSRNLRIAAATSLARLERPSPRTIDMLVDVITAGVPRDGIIEGDLSGQSEYLVAQSAATTLATLLQRDRSLIKPVADRLGDHAAALAMLFGSKNWEQSEDRSLAITPEVADRWLGPLSHIAVTPGSGQLAAIALLGRLPIESEDRDRILLDLLHHGAGDRVPQAAMWALGRVRPTQPRVIDAVRRHLDDCRWGVRSAAIGAAGSMGEEARSLLPELIAVGERSFHTATGSEVAKALSLIAPDDERVVLYLRACDESRAGR